jgi:hypothetical protein
MTVQVVGASASATVDGNGNFTLVNVPAGHVDLHFMGNGTDAHLLLDGLVNNQTLTITVRVNGGSASIENGPNPGPNTEVELEGLVTALGASSLTVDGRVANVTASTVIVHGGTPVAFSSIHVGDRVHVKGTPVSASAPGGPINATKIEVQNPADTEPDGDGDDNGNKGQAEVDGAIVAGSLAGSCAANTLSFRIASTVVRTNASTKFDGASCTALKAGDKVDVKGTRQADASVLASKIEKDDD